MNKKDITQKILSIIGNFNLSEAIQLKELTSLYMKQEQEIERLNNIINELEDLIVIKLQRDYHEHDYRINTGDLEEIYDKLQELKGSDK